MKKTVNLAVNAKSAILVDASSGQVLAAMNEHERLYPASVTKIMTLLLAMEAIDSGNLNLNDTVVTSPTAAAKGGSQIWLKEGETMTVDELLRATAIYSANDACEALGEHLAGSEDAFVAMLNDRAAQLGMKNTHFDNVTGLHSENNYSTAYDMAIILDTALKNEVCKKILSTYQYTTAVTPQHPEGILLSSTLFTYMYGTEPETATILGGKTGYVNESGYCIASYGKNNQNSNEYIIVTLNNSAKMPAIFGQIDLYKEFAK